MNLHNSHLLLHQAAEQRSDALRAAQQDRLVRLARQTDTKPSLQGQPHRVAAMLISATLALLSLFVVSRALLAAPLSEDVSSASIYLPLIASAAESTPAAPTPAPTTVPSGTATAQPTGVSTAVPTDVPTTVPTTVPTNVPTDAPTSEPTATPAPTDVPPVSINGFFVETDWKTASASIQVDDNGGMHLAYIYYEPNTGIPPIGAVYLYCTTRCDEGVNWNGVWFQEEANEVQLALTPGGQPRLLIRTNSTVQSGGRDYMYAECSANCAAPESWLETLVLTSYGTDTFDVSDDDLPQHSFAVDPQGRPAFLYLDRNYPVEPDHYGFFYVTCQSACVDAGSWTQTLVTEVIQEEYFFDWEVALHPSLTFTSGGQPRFIAELMPLGSAGQPTALYYFACDSGCNDRTHWGRVQIGERGQGSALSWDLALDSQNRPRVAHFPAALPNDEGERLWYSWCDANCLLESSWQRVNLGLAVSDGQAPDIELDAGDNPRIAHADSSTGGIGYSWCNGGCGSASNWQHGVVETAEQLYTYWPVAYPQGCDAGFWSSLTPTLALDTAGNPHIAYDATYHARCLYQDPSRPDEPPYENFHLIMRAVRGVYFAQP